MSASPCIVRKLKLSHMEMLKVESAFFEHECQNLTKKKFAHPFWRFRQHLPGQCPRVLMNLRSHAKVYTGGCIARSRLYPVLIDEGNARPQSD